MTEVKDIAGYEGLYTIDTEGRVYSIRRKKYLSLKPDSIFGYAHARLCKNGKVKAYNVHRLVALAFIPNPNNLPIIHHIDGNPQNNAVSNLQWCTQKENVHHAIAAGKHGKMNRNQKKG